MHIARQDCSLQTRQSASCRCRSSGGFGARPAVRPYLSLSELIVMAMVIVLARQLQHRRRTHHANVVAGSTSNAAIMLAVLEVFDATDRHKLSSRTSQLSEHNRPRRAWSCAYRPALPVPYCVLLTDSHVVLLVRCIHWRRQRAGEQCLKLSYDGAESISRRVRARRSPAAHSPPSTYLLVSRSNATSARSSGREWARTIAPEASH